MSAVRKDDGHLIDGRRGAGRQRGWSASYRCESAGAYRCDEQSCRMGEQRACDPRDHEHESVPVCVSCDQRLSWEFGPQPKTSAPISSISRRGEKKSFSVRCLLLSHEITGQPADRQSVNFSSSVLRFPHESELAAHSHQLSIPSQKRLLSAHQRRSSSSSLL